MMKLTWEQKKAIMSDLEERYTEEEIQKFYNIVYKYNTPVFNIPMCMSDLEKIPLKDRESLLGLALFYDFEYAFCTIDEAMFELTGIEFDRLKENLQNRTLDDYFKDFKKEDYDALKEIIIKDGKMGEPFLNYKENVNLASIVDYYRIGKTVKLYSRKNKKIGTQKS